MDYRTIVAFVKKRTVSLLSALPRSMKSGGEKRILFFIAIGAIVGAYCIMGFFPPIPARAVSVTVSGRVISPSCGNGVIDSGEQCDGSNLNNQSCSSFGYSSGNLSCNIDCTLNISACFNNPPPTGGGGGGGGVSSVTQVTFRGIAYPGSPVYLLRDGQQIAQVNASPDARFEFDISGLAGGAYTFMVYSQDVRGIRSPLNSFSVNISNGVSTVVSGIFIPPTVSVDKYQVKQGDAMTVFGTGAPSTTVSISVHSQVTIAATTTAAADGTYVRTFDSSPLAMGGHSAMARSQSSDQISPYSAVALFKVGDSTIYAPTGGCMRADLNCDGRIDLVDFSILAYWYRRPLTSEALSAGVDLNADGKVDLTDFSIMAYYWTG